MGQRVDETADLSQGDDDERLGEAIEQYLALVEQGEAPAPEVFAARHPAIEEDVLSALEGLELVNGLVGRGSGSHPGYDSGPGRNIESGRRIAGYRVVRELGRGGMGTVYEAVHVGLDRPVALKVLGAHAAPDSSARRRFLNEARTAAALHHTHIVPVFDVGQVGGLCYYAMQRIEGSGLDRVIRRRRQLPSLTGSGSTSSRDADATSSQVGERLNRMWVRVSGGLPWAGPRALETDAALEPAPPGIAPERRSDSTASWAPSGGLATLSGPGGWLSASSPRSVLVGATGRDDDAATTFLPPRGSAYFRWAAEVGLQAAEALAHAHHHGVIHRDIKPSNLLIDAQGTIWVADFGLARRLADPGITHHDSLLGTPRYMSPEQGRTGVIDGRTDVYSLGATLYELLTLRPPFDGESAAELLDQIAGREPVPPRAIDRRIPRDLETIVLKTLAKRPADRYASAAALGEDLARFLNREPVRARRISPVGRMWRVARRHPGISTVSTVASVLVLSIAAYAFNTIRNERDQARDATDIAIAEREKTEAAERDTRSAMRTQLWRHAALVRLTSAPDRRTTGLKLLKQAAALEPEPALKTRLRDEAAEFLALRGVERLAKLPTGPVRDLAFDSENARLSVLTGYGEELAVWDVNQKRALEKIALFQGVKPLVGGLDAAPAESAGPRVGPPNPNRGPGGWRRPMWDQRLALTGGAIAVVPTGDQSVLIVNGSTGATVRELIRPDRRVQSVFGEPTGKRLVTVDVENADLVGQGYGPPHAPVKFQVVLWNLERPDTAPIVLDTVLPEPERPRFPLIAFGADGKSLAFALFGSTKVKLFSSDDGRLEGRVESQAEVTALAAGVGGRLATASGATIQIWDGASGDFLTSFSSTRSFVTRLQFNPRGTLLATASGFGAQSQVELWDTIGHKLAAVLPNSDPVFGLGFSTDGRTLVVGGKGVSTSIWKINEPSVRTQISGLAARPASLAFRDDGLLAIGDGAGETWLWCDSRDPDHDAPPPRNVSAQSDRRVDREPAPEPGASRDRFRERGVALAFDARGDLISHDARGLNVWPARPKARCEPTRLELPLFQGGGRFGPSAPPLARSGDGLALALIHGRSAFLWHSEAPSRVVPVVRTDEPAFANPWDFPSPGVFRGDGARRGPGGPGGSRPSRFQAVQLASTGDRLYLLDDAGNVQAWKLQPETDDSIKAEPIRWQHALPEQVAAIALRPDGRLLAAGDRVGVITLVDAASLAVVGQLRPEADEDDEPEGPTTALAFSPDGRSLAAGAQRGSIHFWSASPSSTDYTHQYRLPSQCGRPSSILFDATGRKLAVSGGEPIVEVWDLAAFRNELQRLDLAD